MAIKIWDWDCAAEALPLLAQASLITLQATALGFIVALFVGLLFAIGRMAGPVWLRMGVTGVVEFIRSTLLLIQIFFLCYVMPEFGVTMDAMPTGVLALGLHYGAYCSEVYRAGLANGRQASRSISQRGRLSKMSSCRKRFHRSCPPWATTSSRSSRRPHCCR